MRQARVATTVENAGTVVETVASSETVDAPRPERVTQVVYAGRQGAKGDKGDPGDPGPPGGAAGGFYVHTQNAPATVWTITHNLGFRPGGVHAEDSAGSVIHGDRSDPDVNTTVLTFGAASGGVVYVS